MFKSARLKLTLWYLLTSIIVSFSFSFVIYRLISREVDRFESFQRIRFERRLQDGHMTPPFASPDNRDLLIDTKNRVLFGLALINGVIVISSSFFGYFLAGRTLSPIQNMLDSQKRFVSDASHELKTPLTSLKSAIEVNLMDPSLDIHQAKATLKSNLEDIEKLITLSKSLLTLSSNQEGALSQPLEKLSISKMLSKSLAALKNQSTRKNISLVYKPVKISVNGNEASLVELFTLITDNAIKFSPPKSKVTIRTSSVGNHCQIKIIDHGIGIKESELPFIFDRFYQTNSSRSDRNNSSFGLGLSIAKSIVLQHHGEISVSSKVNEGTTITVNLPLA